MPDALVFDKIGDNEIISRVIGGEKDLYAVIMRRYNRRLYRIAMSIVNDDSEAEDVMQVSYIHAWENLNGFGARASFSTWLIRILINECLLRLKKRGRILNLTDETMENELSQHHNSEVPTPAGRLLNTELKAALEQSIRQLPEKYRVVFVMREIEGMNVADTQACLAISEVNVKVRLNRAKAMLKESLLEFYNREDILQFHLSRCSRMVENVMDSIVPPGTASTISE